MFLPLQHPHIVYHTHQRTILIHTTVYPNNLQTSFFRNLTLKHKHTLLLPSATYAPLVPYTQLQSKSRPPHLTPPTSLPSSILSTPLSLPPSTNSPPPLIPFPHASPPLKPTHSNSLFTSLSPPQTHIHNIYAHPSHSSNAASLL